MKPDLCEAAAAMMRTYLSRYPELWLLFPFEMQTCIDDCYMGYVESYGLVPNIIEFIGLDPDPVNAALILIGV